MLKFKYPSKNEIPADHAPFYTERDGAWLLNAEGIVDKSRFDESHQQNLTLQKQLDEMSKRFEGIDPDNVRAQLEEKRKLEEAQALKAGEIDKILESRAKALKTEFDHKYSALSAERDSLSSKLTDIQINQGVILAGTKRGLRPSAIVDITARARNTFKLVNGVPRAFEPDGSTVRLGANAEPMTIDEWITTQVAEAPHLFESNSGSGATGSTSVSVDSSNPWKRESWNLTKQGELLRKDPARARALQSSARSIS